MTVALLILGFYALFMWLVFYRFKWLKFNIAWGVVTFWVGFHVLFLLIVFLRFYTPYTIDGHVIRQTIQIAPRLPHPTVLQEVYVSQNQKVKRGTGFISLTRPSMQRSLPKRRRTWPMPSRMP